MKRRKSDPKLHVIDNALLDPLTRKLWRHTKKVERLLPTAGRFVLTDDASYKLGKIVKKTADLLLRNHQFAIPPLPVTYLELNLRLMHEALGAPTTNNLNIFNHTTADERVGYLLANDRIYAFSSDYGGLAAPTPFVIRKVDASHQHQMMPIAFSPHGYSGDELVEKFKTILTETQNWNRLAILLGSSLHQMPDEETRQAYLNNWAIEMDAWDGLDYRDERLYLAGAGELRTVHAALLVLNQPRLIQTASVGRSVGHPSGKRTVYAGHSVINIELGQRKQYRRLFLNGTHATPRRHRVRGHFVHYNSVKGCIHDWPTIPDYIDPPRWFCRKCNTLRVWKEHFMRGDAGKGFVTNEYNVEGEAA